MPGLDRMGPFGQGPGTGRRMGRCFGYRDRNGKEGGFLGFGRRRMRGLCDFRPRRGRWGFLTGGSEKDQLLEEKSFLERQLNRIKERLSAIES